MENQDISQNKIIKIGEKSPLTIEQLVEISLRVLSGEIIIYPTDTVYGIAASIPHVDSLYRAKVRDGSKPIPILIDNIAMLDDIAQLNQAQRKVVEKLAHKYWPGGLTIIMPKNAVIPDSVTSGADTVGVRIPDDRVALAIINACGGLLPTTSANISGESAPASFDELSQEIISNADIIVDGGKCKVEVASTIVDISSVSPTCHDIRIIRQGAISEKEILEIIE